MKNDYFSKALDFLKSIKETDNVIVVFNNDADGISSCALLCNYLKTKNIDPFIISQPMPTDKNLLRRIQTTIPNKIIFTDLSMDQQEQVIQKTSGIADVLIIDHHSIYKDMNYDNIVHHNPRFSDSKIYQSATYLVYKLCRELMEVEKSLWIAAVGIIGDYNTDYSQDVVKDIKNKYSLDALYESFLGRVADMISAVRSRNEMSCEEIVNIFKNLESYEDFEKTDQFKKMSDCLNSVNKEIERIENDFNKNREKYGDLIFYEIKSDLNICSAISTRISSKIPENVVIIYQNADTRMRVSGRNQSQKHDVASIMKKAVSGLKGSAGGHPAAAGANVMVNDWETFKENIKKQLN